MHEILENDDTVERVLGGLESTLGLLDDLEENLNIFDTKLRHMREDIAGGCGRGKGNILNIFDTKLRRMRKDIAGGCGRGLLCFAGLL